MHMTRRRALCALQRGGRSLAFGTQALDAPEATVPLSVAAFGVWGANTGVGKTLLSAALVAAQVSATRSGALFLKPLQTGFPSDSDAELVAAAAARASGAGAVNHSTGDHAAVAADAGGARPRWLSHLGGGGVSVTCRTLFAWTAPVGPHAAVELEGRGVTDAAVVEAVARELNSWAGGHGTLALVEGAGGVASPGPSGVLQCDVYRRLRLPAVLVGDGRLGGISATVCAFEALYLRGYDVAAVALMDEGLRNEEALTRHLPAGVPVFKLPAAPAAPAPGPADRMDPNLAAWLDAARPCADALVAHLHRWHAARVAALRAAPAHAHRTLWWPFTQHEAVAPGDVCVIDARAGDALLVHDDAQGRVVPLTDACSSWWTQGVDEANQPAVARALGHAAGRFGHVMFPQSAHAPALTLADRLLAGPGAGWASRVFYSDDGSTATEIALKMALRLYASRRGGALELAKAVPPRVLALSGSYHGDTLGAACAGAPSVYNAPHQAPWYSPRALILEPATVSMTRDGAWQVTQAGSAGGEVFATREQLFSPGRDASPLVERYRAAVSEQLDRAARESPVAGEVAAAIIEPLLHGAGGMVFIDPAFQRALVTVCQSRGIPVIADEVFSGLWRLGAPGACQLLGIVPDVACYAKLLTGGTVPLAATLAGEHVFDAFRGGHKTDALLHGHSYSGHAIGCAAAVEALDALGDPARNLNLVAAAAHGLRLRELWCPARTAALAAHPSVQRSLCLGTVYAAELVASSPGYASHAAQDVVRRLRVRGVYARPIGNVVYLMVSPMAQPHTCDRLLDALTAELGAPATEHGRGGVVC